MITIRTSALALLANIKQVIKASRSESINAENTVEFTAILDTKSSNAVEAGNVVEVEGDFFDIAYYNKAVNGDGTKTVVCEAEHVSYRLNNSTYDLETFGMTGTPTQILTAILNGTGFTVGTVEPTTSGAYTINEKSSRRALLIGFANAIGAELSFDKFAVSLLTRRGDVGPALFTAGKNVRIVNKIYNGRQTPALVSYEAEPIALPTKPLALGDNVLLVQPELNVSESLRIVSISYNPMDKLVSDIQISNYVQTLENQFYRMQTETVVKGKLYNGCSFGPDDGFVAERSDGAVKAMMNATEGFSLWVDPGTGLVKVFYVDVDGKLMAKSLEIDGNSVFKGTAEAATISGGIVTGALIRTAATGERIELDSYNRIQFYDSTGTVIGTMRLEDGYLKLKALSGQKIQIETLGANMSIGPYGAGYKLYVINTLDLGGNSIVNAVVDGYATESWVGLQGFLTGNGISGSFTTVDGKTVSVADGLITSIV